MNLALFHVLHLIRLTLVQCGIISIFMMRTGFKAISLEKRKVFVSHEITFDVM